MGRGDTRRGGDYWTRVAQAYPHEGRHARREHEREHDGKETHGHGR